MLAIRRRKSSFSIVFIFGNCKEQNYYRAISVGQLGFHYRRLKGSKIGFLNPKRILRFFFLLPDQSKITRIMVHKGTEESLPKVNSAVPLTRHDPIDLGLRPSP